MAWDITTALFLQLFKEICLKIQDGEFLFGCIVIFLIYCSFTVQYRRDNFVATVRLITNKKLSYRRGRDRVMVYEISVNTVRETTLGKANNSLGEWR